MALRDCRRVPRGNRHAPFDQAVTVRARVAPVDTEERARSSFHRRERALAPDRDELLAKGNLPLVADACLEAEQAALRYLPGGDFVHGRHLSAQSLAEVGWPGAA